MENTDQNKKPVAADAPAEIEQLKEELAREHDMYLRALADFDNYRKRVERERATANRGGKREIMRPLLEVVDGFDRALNHMDDAPSVDFSGCCGRCTANYWACWKRRE